MKLCTTGEPVYLCAVRVINPQYLVTTLRVHWTADPTSKHPETLCGLTALSWRPRTGHGSPYCQTCYALVENAWRVEVGA